MFDFDYWQEIWLTITRNRTRSIMTAFGVGWGIFMLVVMMGAGSFLERKVFGSMKNMESNSVFLWTSPTSLPYKGLQSERRWNIELEDVSAIRTHVQGVKWVAPVNFGNQSMTSRYEKSGSYSTKGYTPDYIHIIPQIMLYGRFVNDADLLYQRKVCVLSQKVYKELFAPGEDPVGQLIQIGQTFFTVIGVAIPTIADMFEDDLIVPLTTLQQMYNRGNDIDMLMVTAENQVPIHEVEDRVKALIKVRHDIHPEDLRAIGSFNFADAFEPMQGLFLGIVILTWIVGGGTLLAGIIGISNIMLVSIRERTQEIGIRRALGASPGAIIRQILSESFILTFVAGATGLFCGVGLLSLIDTLMAGQVSEDGLPFPSCQVTFGFAVGAAVILTVGGILAGMIPANRALQMKPVDAIREE